MATTSRVRPCELVAVDADAAGNVYVGGGSYMAFELAGKKHPARGFEQMVLASFDANGAPRWSRAFGTQWHNLVRDLRVIGDRLFVVGTHANGFDAGGVRLPNIPPPKVKGQDTGFESETGFVAAYDAEGKALWAKNLSRLLSDADRPGVSAGLYNRAIYPDGASGAWVLFNEGEASTHVAHLSASGDVLHSRTIDLSSPAILLGGVTTIDRAGNLFHLWKTKEGVPWLRRAELNGTTKDAALPALPTTYPQWGALRVFDDGRVHVALVGDQILSGAYRYEAHVVAVDASGRVTLNRPLMRPGQATRQTQLTSVSAADGEDWLLAVRHNVPLDVDGTSVPASGEGTTSLLELSPDARRTVRVRAFAGASCVGLRPETLTFFPSTPGRLLAVGAAPPRSASILCGDTRVQDGVVAALTLPPP